MESLSLSQLFGEGATQTSTTLIIPKADLIGLTASANNTAESLLAAILLTALTNFQGVITDENGQLITDENGAAIFYDNSEIFEEIKLFFWRKVLTNRNLVNYATNQFVFEFYARYQWFT